MAMCVFLYMEACQKKIKQNETPVIVILGGLGRGDGGKNKTLCSVWYILLKRC